jgi:hypothetical protein
MGSTYKLDGASYTEIGDSEARIRPRMSSMFHIGLLSLFLVGLMALMLKNILDAIKGTQSLNVPALFLFSMVGVFLAYVIYYSFTAIRRPPVTISRDTRRIEIGRRSNKRTVDFDQVAFVSIVPAPVAQLASRRSREKEQLAARKIYLILSDGGSVFLGTVSDKAPKVQARAQRIAQSVAALIDANYTATTDQGEVLSPSGHIKIRLNLDDK